MRLPVRIVGLYGDPMSDATIVMLGEPGEVTRVLPIFIGAAEAQSIALALAGVEMTRPGTHDLMLAALESLGTRVDSVTVTTLVDGAFVAEVVLEDHERFHVLDARPSDGIALAIRSGGLLLVENSVMDEASVTVGHRTDQPFDDAEIENIVAEFHDFLATTEPHDFTGGERADDEPSGHEGADEPGISDQKSEPHPEEDTND